jgi:hypothetical protein
MKESDVQRVPLAVCALLVFVAGCGGGTTDGDDDASATTAPAVIAAVEP